MAASALVPHRACGCGSWRIFQQRPLLRPSPPTLAFGASNPPRAANHAPGPGVGDHPPRVQVRGLSPVLMLDPWNRRSCTIAAHLYLHHPKPQAESAERCMCSWGLGIHNTCIASPAPTNLRDFLQLASQLLDQAADAWSTNHTHLDFGIPQPNSSRL